MEGEGIKGLVEVLKNAREGSLGPFDYKLGTKNVKGEMQINDALVKAMIGYNGNWNLQGEMPLWGGQLNLEASKQDGNPYYGLQFQKNF